MHRSKVLIATQSPTERRDQPGVPQNRLVPVRQILFGRGGCTCLRTTRMSRLCSAGRPSTNCARDLPKILLIATSISGLPQSTARRLRLWKRQTVTVRTARSRSFYSREVRNADPTAEQLAPEMDERLACCRADRPRQLMMAEKYEKLAVEFEDRKRAINRKRGAPVRLGESIRHFARAHQPDWATAAIV